MRMWKNEKKKSIEESCERQRREKTVSVSFYA